MDVAIPARAHALVIAAHGSKGGGRSRRAQRVGRRLRRAGLGTVLVDLVDPAEGESPPTAVLVERVADVIARLREEEAAAGKPIGLLGGDGAAAEAALAAARRLAGIGAVAGHGQVAGETLHELAAPTMLLAGEVSDDAFADLAARFFRDRLVNA